MTARPSIPDTVWAAHQRLLDAFAFEIFSRLQARGAGLEADLWMAESFGLAKFVRCAGSTPDGRVYCSDFEQFRLLS